MGAEDGVGLGAAEVQIAGAVYGLRNAESLAAGAGSGAVIAGVEIDQDVNSAVGDSCRFVVPGDLLDVIYHYHGAGVYDAGHFVRVGDWGGEQEVGDTGLGHEFGFGDGGYADAGGSGG